MPTKNDGFKDFILDQLAELKGVTARTMFGGYGLYQRAKFSASFIKAACISKSRQRPRVVTRNMA
jgi:TfoX/Sxy family transcriptional regulator of competence genes